MTARAVIPVCLALVLAGCTHITAADRAPRTSVLERLTPTGPSPWREDLGDPVLRDLLRQVDAASLDEKTALSRLTRARAEVLAAKAVGSIQVGIGADAAVGGRNFSSSDTGALPSLTASYEFDLWGRLAKGRAAAGSDAEAATADVTLARLLVGEETARTYVAFRRAEEARGLAVRRRDLCQSSYALIKTRVAGGAADGEEASNARRGLAEAEARLQAAGGEVDQQRIRLGVLLGQTGPWTPSGGETRLVPAGSPSAEVSSSLVDRRPDVMAAFARLSAADSRRAQAVAAAEPQFIISAALGAPDAAIVNLLDARSLAWALAATLSHALIDGQAGRARIDAATAEADTADLAYRKAVVQGWAEIREAVIDQATAMAVLDQARAGLIDAHDAVLRGRTRHAGGTLDGVGLLAIEDREAAAIEEVGRAGAGLLDARLRLALVTGG